MTNIDYTPIDPDAISAAVAAEDRQRVEDLCDSIAWYKRQRERSGGWNRAIEQCEEELEELTGTSDVAELEAVLEAGDERDGPADQEKEIAQLEEEIEFYERKNYGKDFIERQYDRLRQLKEGG
jgi:hypothetical protein